MKHFFLWIVLAAGSAFFLPSCSEQVPGCTDPLAANYNPDATINDGSCQFSAVMLTPEFSMQLDDRLTESSGLISWDAFLWTHNDNDDPNLYRIDTSRAAIDTTVLLEGVTNTGWEEISRDREHIYIGDFGNNQSGNRSDLHILRVSQASLYTGNKDIDTLWFSYGDQADLSPSEPNRTDYDCEAFVVTGDSIYLFTKQWLSPGTAVYRIPKEAGTHVAERIASYPVVGMITGASLLEDARLLVLCGYDILLNPFFYLFYDYQGRDFFSGNVRRVDLSLPFHQVEGIATWDGMRYYISNEAFSLESLIATTQALHLVDLEDLLGNYLSGAGGS